MPAWVTSENIRFNGTTLEAAVLKTDGANRTVILWDNLTSGDQALLTNFVNTYGGTLPLAGPTSGVQTVEFGKTVVGGTATGLSNVAVATAASTTVDIGGAATGGQASGLSAAVGTQGSQVVNFSTPINGATSTGLTPTAGYQDITFSALAGGGDATNLVGGTTYTTTITVDGVAKPISILGSNASTFTNLVSEINTDLGASATAVLDVANKRIRITSATTSTSSTVLAVQGTLFAAPLANFSAITAAVAGTGSLAALTATITVDGVAKAISVLPASIGTFTALINEINTDLGASATAAIVGQDIKVTSATFGSASKVVITPGTLFPALPSYVGTIPPQNGVSQSRTYSATVTVDGVIKSVKFLGTAGDTIQHVIDEINADLGASATAALTGGNIVITSATTGSGSSVVVDDNGFLFNRLTGYVGITNTLATAPTVYTATITVDGVDKAISLQGNTAQTFTNLVSQINTDLGASAVASIANNKLVVTSASTGVTSTVVIRDGNLLKALGATGVSKPVDGISDLVVAMKKIPVGSSNLYDYLGAFVVGDKPPRPAVPAVLPKTPAFTYFDGTNWKYLEDDTNV